MNPLINPLRIGSYRGSFVEDVSLFYHSADFEIKLGYSGSLPNENTASIIALWKPFNILFTGDKVSIELYRSCGGHSGLILAWFIHRITTEMIGATEYPYDSVFIERLLYHVKQLGKDRGKQELKADLFSLINPNE